MGITRGRTAIDGFFKTTTDLINYAGKPKLDQIIETDGSTTLGDGSGAKWKATGNIIVASQNLGNIISDANGNEYSKILTKLNIRASKLDNPLTHILKKNKLVETLSGALTTTRTTTATYVDRYGVVKTAAINTLREEKDGWLFEGASTNLLTYSGDSSNAAFLPLVGNSKNLTGASVTNPDLTTQTTELTSVSGGIFRQFIPISTTNKTLSLWVYITNKDSANAIIVDYGDGAGVSTSISLVPINTWTRLSLENIIKGTGDFIDIAVNGITNAMTWYIWGRQLEALPFASSYIPTTTAAVTRAADNVSFVFDENFTDFRQLLTVNANYKMLGYPTANSLPYLFITSVLSNNIRYITNNGYNANSITTSYGTSNIDSTITSLTGRATVIFNGVNVITYKDGIQITAFSPTVTAVTRPLVVRIGDGYFYGHIQDFRVYDFALNQDEVRFLSGV